MIVFILIASFFLSVAIILLLFFSYLFQNLSYIFSIVDNIFLSTKS